MPLISLGLLVATVAWAYYMFYQPYRVVFLEKAEYVNLYLGNQKKEILDRLESQHEKRNINTRFVAMRYAFDGVEESHAVSRNSQEWKAKVMIWYFFSLFDSYKNYAALLYLAYVPYPFNKEGIQGACQYYFSREIRELDDREQKLLLALFTYPAPRELMYKGIAANSID